MLDELNMLLERVIIGMSGNDPNKYGMRPGAMRRMGLKPITPREKAMTKGKDKAAKDARKSL